MNYRNPWVVVGAIVLNTVCVARVDAQWVVERLHPTMVNGESRCLAIHGGYQAGYVVINGVKHASRWSGTSSTWEDLHPAGAAYSIAHGTHGIQQVGLVRLGGNRAAAWPGTQLGFEDLTGERVSAIILGISEGAMVGQATIPNAVGTRASLWTDGAESWIDLTPVGGGPDAEAFGVAGGQQVGYVHFGGLDHASLWTGTAASWTDLNPIGAGDCVALAVHNGTQVGRAFVAGITQASKWSGTSLSWQSLHPSIATHSEAFAVHLTEQVGWAYVDGTAHSHAILWTGTASSWIDLHAFVPAGFSDSQARGISHEAGFTYIVGDGYNMLTGRSEALLWKQYCFSCHADFNCSGGLTVQDVFDFIAAWFAGDPRGDFNGTNGTNVTDIFSFLDAWFAGCG